MPQLLFLLYTSGAINQVYGMLGVSLIIIFVWQWLRVKRVHLYGINTSTFILLVLFSVAYVFIGEFSLQGFEYYLACPILSFLCGWVTLTTSKEKSEETIKLCVYFILIGFAIHAALNISVNFGKSRWELIDYFTGSDRSATGSGCINTMIFSLSAYIIVVERNIIFKICGIIASFISLFYAFILGTRTQFLILIITTFIFLFFYLHEKYKWTGVIRLLFVFALLIGVFLYMYRTNKFGVKTYVDASNLLYRFTHNQDLYSADNHRFSSIAKGLKNVVWYPFGGLKDEYYYHNLWLDVGRVSGIIPFTSLLFFSVITNIHAIKIFRDHKRPDWFRYMILCLYFGIQINFITEPVLEGLLGFFLTYIAIVGMVEAYYYQSESITIDYHSDNESIDEPILTQESSLEVKD